MDSNHWGLLFHSHLTNTHTYTINIQGVVQSQGVFHTFARISMFPLDCYSKNMDMLKLFQVNIGLNYFIVQVIVG